MSPQFLRTEVRHFLVLSGDPEFVMLKQDPPPPNPPSSFMCAPTWLLSIKRHLLRKVEKPKRDHEHDQVCHPRGTFWGRSGFQGQDAGSSNVFSASSLPRRRQMKVKCSETRCPLHTRRICHTTAVGLEDLSL